MTEIGLFKSRLSASLDVMTCLFESAPGERAGAPGEAFARRGAWPGGWRVATLAALLIACLTAAGLSSGARAQDSSPWATEPFPGYDLSCGLPVVFATTPQVALASRTADGAPVVVLDPRLTTEEETFQRAFLSAHECAHHQLGHTLPEALEARRNSQDVVRDQELSADCRAGETLAALGHLEAVVVIAERFHTSGPYSPGGGYPSGWQRALMLKECAARGLATRELAP